MSEALQIVRLFWEEVWSRGRTELVAELFDPGARENGEPVDVQAFTKAVSSWVKVFPDFTARIEEMLEVDGRVVSRVTYRGTHRGTWAGLPATGRIFECIGIDIFTVVAGRITELWHAADHYDMAWQLGAQLVPRGER